MLPILNPPPSSLPTPSLWVVPVHQPQASSIAHQTWTGNSATRVSILFSSHVWNTDLNGRCISIGVDKMMLASKRRYKSDKDLMVLF